MVYNPAMPSPIKVGISTCLLGEKVRYDGGHKLDHYLKDTLGRYVHWVPVCPEVESGLPTPREAMHLSGDPENPRLVTVRTGVDHTETVVRWTSGKLDELADEKLCGFVFKNRSPSSGMTGIKIYRDDGTVTRKGSGIFADRFMKRFPLLPVEDDGRLHDPGLRENFIERVFVFHRWRELTDDPKLPPPGRLVEFHSDHKLLIMAHSPKHLRLLGKLVAQGRKLSPGDLYSRYAVILMEGLNLKATTRKNVNVLQHMMGYFKKVLTPDEKQEMLEVIDRYHRGLVPLVVPLVLFSHYVRKYDQPYLRRQHYLKPHPAELMLRTHV
jgi:uncharacterized protein YbgA (DUF1722 family)/uncharacterized protein YbbK (DUF523 family)